MTEDEALDRVTEIGQAFANDLNDGDGPVLYEGLDVTGGDEPVLSYQATLEDGTEVVYRWALVTVR